MRLVTYRVGGDATAAARVEGNEVVTLPFADVGELLAQTGWRQLAEADGQRQPYDESRIATLITRPPKVWCVGMNYASHIAETNGQTPTFPTLFAKFSVALTGPYDEISLPDVSEKVDWEVELAIVIGRAGRAVTAADAMDYIAGYTVMNDVSMRDWQKRTSEFLQGKTFGSCSALGPQLVTVDEAPDPHDGIGLTCTVNDEVMQSAKTDDMVFTVRDLVAYVSQIAPLEPGDVIATGTPAGIGALRKPPRFIQSGDVVECAIDGIGAIRNRFV